MKKILLSQDKPYFKANLHCHSVISDGGNTPEELKEMYMAHGYSIIAYTDHDALIGHNDLTDDRFLALNGYEMEINEKVPGRIAERRTCHMCYIALKPDNLKQVCYHRSKYLFGNAPNYRSQLQFDESKPDFVREYTPECINKMIAEGRENGFFVTYNHPAWSFESALEYCSYRGMNAMEICNYSSVAQGFPDYVEQAYDDILRGGQKIFCIAADDNHGDGNDSYGGFTVINADKLEYTTVTDALVKGSFYASEGPKIYDLWYEDGQLGITCSDAASIRLTCGTRHCKVVYPEEGKPLTSAVFPVREDCLYARITVTDHAGKHANTNAYYIEDLLK